MERFYLEWINFYVAYTRTHQTFRKKIQKAR